MINFVEGDLLFSNCDVVVHGVAPGDHFNQGLALSLKEKWPAMYKDFRHYCQIKHPSSGEIWAWGGASKQKIVALFTQEAPDREGGLPGRASQSHVKHALKNLREFLKKENVKSVALPKLATGVGKLDWNDVKPLIEKELGDLNIQVDVYHLYKAGNSKS